MPFAMSTSRLEFKGRMQPKDDKYPMRIVSVGNNARCKGASKLSNINSKLSKLIANRSKLRKHIFMAPGYNIPLPRYVLVTTKTFITVLLSAITLFSIANPAQAEEQIADKFRIAIGGYTIPSMDTTISLTEATLGAGVSISPQDTLGLDTQYTVLRLDGYYRFNKKHSLTYSWYSINSRGSKILEEEFTWLDENGNTITIPIGASAQTQLDYDIFKLGYSWSFYHSNKVELAAGGGLHITKVAINLNVNDTLQGAIDTKDIKTTVPLPVLSVGLTYHASPKFHWYLKSEAFALAFEDWEGVYTDSALGLEYRFWKNLGLGAGLGSNALKVIEKTGEYKFSYDNRIAGLMLYVAGYF